MTTAETSSGTSSTLSSGDRTQDGSGDAAPLSGRPVLDVLALTTAAAGVVHIPTAVAHGLGTLVGSGMLAVGLMQILLAVRMWMRPARTLVAGTVLANVGAAVVLALVHTTGLPVPQMREPELFSAQAVAVLGLEGVAAVTGLFLLGGAAGPVRTRRWLVPVTAVAVLAVCVPAVASSGSHAHTHGGHTSADGGRNSHGHSDGDGGPAPIDRYQAFTAGMNQQDVDAALRAQTNWIVDYVVTKSASGVTREQIFPVIEAGVARAVSSGEGNGGHGHTGLAPWKPISDPAIRITLASQLERSRAAALALPTAANAVAAGYVQVTQYLPGIGAHYVNVAHVLDGAFDPARPEILLYSSNGPSASVVGVSYVQLGTADQEPAGFAGPNDVWHFHEGLCEVSRMVVPVPEPSASNCNKVGGTTRALAGGDATQRAWMMHAWVVPGWESPWGLFSSENPELTLAVGELT